MFNFLKKNTIWIWSFALFTLSLLIFLTLFPTIKLPKICFFIIDEFLIPKIFNLFILLAEYYSQLLLWIVHITPPFPDIFNWIDLVFSLKFQKDVTYFICYTIPNFYELFDYLFKIHDFFCSFVEALMLVYISIKVLLNWILYVFWPILLTIFWQYKRIFFNQNQINQFIQDEKNLFFEWLVLYYQYSQVNKITSYFTLLPMNYNFSSKKWFSLWLGWSFRLKFTNTNLANKFYNPIIIFFDNQYIMSLKFLIFIGYRRKYDWFIIEKSSNKTSQLLIITVSESLKKKIKIHPQDLNLLEHDRFLYFTLKDLLFCYLLKFKFWKLPTTQLPHFYITHL